MALRATWGRQEPIRYTRVAILLHWAIAALILYNLASGLLQPLLPRGFFVFHISSGITILVLSLFRVVWRLTHRPPPLVPMAPWERGLAHVVHFLLYAAMLVLPFSGWAMISASPPAGSAGAEWARAHPAHGHPPVPAIRPATPGAGRPAGQDMSGGQPPRPHGPTMIWGVVKLPLIAPVNRIGALPDGVPRQRELHERIETFHGIGGWIMLALLILHTGGALKHQFVDRRRELGRMGIGRA